MSEDTITCARKGCFVEIPEDDIWEDRYELIIFTETSTAILFCAECSFILSVEWEGQIGSPLPEDYIDDDADTLFIMGLPEDL